ncbi:hypothetical protein FS749_009861 [Ceratobasidium sp. UAMH 11750]|nr:hypothetical protein FS749_009861 [Ceratobasidium sp. UAMH 11750]
MHPIGTSAPNPHDRPHLHPAQSAAQLFKSFDADSFVDSSTCHSPRHPASPGQSSQSRQSARVDVGH